ncbi:MAG: DNA gyrase subunit A [Lysobacteraceae bacterium SCN 69-123]|jgi:DNA gyrase subunit A|uniref:DNA gyrase subunit A n=2 Tax=Stenotrophomonas TaxID=40323 RepID=A0A0R0E5Y3_9GAMM|nr:MULTISPECIES: DNA gyrase subunit A [Stenotrophomonas]ODU46035.1 MAG: DNA gyrase subunit A [Xanthomonadaceae bacterium SCN 69-123]OJY73743.1 MAG: DNA gyrase subunit A [Stenotrophomonas sp. 69-14]ALJ28631.1 DNA gyrase subunit A [Stenotrophomonas acidaminiphila]KRG85460.1 DNA gyrase subunit A [Stenotrophomonas acidaminiphila]MBN8800949.1 DNA gyrase subunit A [Stenotrophomonas acidaminiphila]
MAETAKEIIQVNLEDEMRKSYLDYAMSVIVGRALPDARDGLKPVHRRVLYAMQELGAHANKPYYKSARIVGDVIGKYHPHGDSAVYDTLVRMAQPFSLRYMQIDGQGNFGSVDGDSPAAMRYTESRLSRISHEMLADIDKETVDFQPNYDEKELEPTVLPTRFPNLLVNGSAGIAVGMATNIPPHNLTESINACIALIDNPSIDVDGLMEYIPGPDFPTAGIINGTAGIIAGYRTGRGRVRIRAKADIEVADNGRESIIVTEIPYQVNKARLIEKIAELVKEKKLEGISELRDESDKDGMRIYIEVKRGESAEVVLNNLYQQTQMESVFGINMVALVDGRPKLLNLKEMLEAFVRHRREVVTRRTIFELRKARARAHVLEGLTVALANIDEMIELIKTSSNPAEAKERMLAKVWEPGLVGALLGAAGAEASRPEDLPRGIGLVDGRYQLSDVQATQILEMRLHRLTGLEQDKLTEEYRQLLDVIAGLIHILENPDRLLQVIREELESVRAEYGDERRTEIRHSEEDLDILDLIAPEDVVVTLSRAGYVKRQPVSAYRAQKRGGRGRSAAATKDEDSIEQLWLVNTHDTLLTFTSSGKVFWLPVYQLPEAGSNARGRPIINWIALENGERVQAVLPVREYDDNHFVFFATRNGTVKKTPLSEFAFRLARGKIAINLDEGDALVGVGLTDGERDILLFASNGKTVRFGEDRVRSMGRTATGVRGIKMAKGEEVVSLIVAESAGGAEDENEDDTGAEDMPVDAGEIIESADDAGVQYILTATENGYGKRTPLADYPRKGRGTQGVIGIQTSERNGKLVSAVLLGTGDEVLLISDGGTLVRTRGSEISRVGRNTQGVTLIRLSKGEKLQAVERLDASLQSGDDADEDVASGDAEPAVAPPQS